MRQTLESLFGSFNFLLRWWTECNQIYFSIGSDPFGA